MGLNLTALGAGATAAVNTAQNLDQLQLAKNADLRAQNLANQQTTLFNQQQAERAGRLAAGPGLISALTGNQPLSLTATQPQSQAPTSTQPQSQAPTTMQFDPNTGLPSTSSLIASPLGVASVLPPSVQLAPGGTSPQHAMAVNDLTSAYNNNVGWAGKGGHQNLNLTGVPTSDGGMVVASTNKATGAPVSTPQYVAPDALSAYYLELAKTDPQAATNYASLMYQRGVAERAFQEKLREFNEGEATKRQGNTLTYLGTRYSADQGLAGAKARATAEVTSAGEAAAGVLGAAKTRASQDERDSMRQQTQWDYKNRNDMAAHVAGLLNTTYQSAGVDAPTAASDGQLLGKLIATYHPDALAQMNDPNTPEAERLNILERMKMQMNPQIIATKQGATRFGLLGRSGGDGSLGRSTANSSISQAMGPGGIGLSSYLKQVLGLASDATVRVGGVDGQDIPLSAAVAIPGEGINPTLLNSLKRGYYAHLPPSTYVPAPNVSLRSASGQIKK